jgi:hypothetical protein
MTEENVLWSLDLHFDIKDVESAKEHLASLHSDVALLQDLLKELDK